MEDLEPILQAILRNGHEKSTEANSLLEGILGLISKDSNVESLIESNIELQNEANKKLEKIIEELSKPITATLEII